MIDHPARVQVAEILVDLPDGSHTRGSGYLVAPGWVLTASHVVRAATSIGVWLGAPPELQEDNGMGVDPSRVLRAVRADLALLPINRGGTSAAVDLAPFGRLDRESTEPVQVVAAGFPRFKLRSAPGRQGVLLRDLHFTIGTIVGGSNTKTGTYEYSVHAAPDEDPSPKDHSPWEGMSGAAVWAGGRLIGVIGQHYPRENRGTLAVRPIEALFAEEDATQLVHWRNASSQLSVRVEDLWAVTPPSTRDLAVRRANQAAMRLAPEILIARDSELAALSEFAGSRQQWRWVRGDPFAGKTALLAWFALHPPDAVDIAACFLRSTSGENTLDYALDMLTRQLAVFANVNIYSPPRYPSERVSHFFELLEFAARACGERNRRLLLLVDGLDEYQISGFELAAWLPDGVTLPQEASLLVSSREEVDVDLPTTSPLHQNSHFLSASDAATEMQAMARRELTVAVGDPGGLSYPLVGCLAAADGGLTSSELGILIKRSGRNTFIAEINTLIRTTLRRSLMRISDGEGDAEPVHVFAHDTLMSEACVLFESDLPFFRGAVHSWADEYAQSGWPVTAPRYLLAPYAKMLKDIGEPARLAAIATSRSRHELMLQRTLGDAAALVEIAYAQELQLAEARPDLTILTLLAIERDRLIHRNQALPDSLPALWVQLGEAQYGQALARSLADPSRQVVAWARLAAALASEGHTESAERAADYAERAAATLKDPWVHARASARMAIAFARDMPEKAERAAHDAESVAYQITQPRQRAVALARLAGALASAGFLRESERIANSIEDPAPRAAAMRDLTIALGVAGQMERAVDTAHRAQSAAASISEPTQQASALADVACALAAIRQLEEAKQTAVSVVEPLQRALAFSCLANALVEAGDWKQATGVVKNAQRDAASIRDASQRAAALSYLTGALAAIGETEKAERVADSVGEPAQRARAFSRLAGRAIGRQPDVAVRAIHHAEKAANSITEPGEQAAVLADLADALAAAGHLEQAVSVAAKIPDMTQRARVLTQLAVALSASGQHEHALRTAREAQMAATSVTNLRQEAAVLADLADALAAAGHLEHAVRAGTSIADSGLQAQVLARLAEAFVAAGQLEQAERVAARITDSLQRANVLAHMVEALTAGGYPEQAVKAAVHIKQPGRRALALAATAIAFADENQVEQAERAAEGARQAAADVTDPEQRARVLARIAATLTDANQVGRAERAAWAAERVATRTTGQHRPSWTLADIANELADSPEQLGRNADDIVDLTDKRGTAERISETVQNMAISISDSDLKASAHLRLAERYAQLDSEESRLEAYRLCGLVLTGPSWRQAFFLIGKLDAQCLVAVVDELVKES